MQFRSTMWAVVAVALVLGCEVDEKRGLRGLTGDAGDAAAVDGEAADAPDAPVSVEDAAAQDAVVEDAEADAAPDAGPTCGNGKVEASEACDDGNAANTDGCLNDCTVAACGDGKIQAGVEACDDANAVETDGCLSNCTNAVCGDGKVRAGVEQCDDGNRVNDDQCSNECALPGCGDGIVQANEACDDGNRVNEDACTNACQPARCGDGIKRATEACDDGNTNNNDACLDNCTPSKCLPQPNVDDGNPCTTDSCDPFKGPVHTPVAVGTACPDDNVCDGVNRCNANGQCVAAPALPVDMSNPCRKGSCDPKKGPVYENLPRGSTCADSNICNGQETCDGQGQCQAGAAVSARTPCDDGNVCNGINRCDGKGSCQISLSVSPRGSSCSAGNMCLICNGQGVCESPTPQGVDDGDGCTVDSCDMDKGAVHVADGRLQMSCTAICGCVQRPGSPICVPTFCAGSYQCVDMNVVCQPAIIF